MLNKINEKLALVAWLINLRSTKNLRKVNGIKCFKAYSSEYTSVKSRDYRFNNAIKDGLVQDRCEHKAFSENYIYTPTEKGIKELENALNIRIEMVD